MLRYSPCWQNRDEEAEVGARLGVQGMTKFFYRFAEVVARAVGTVWAFVTATLILIVWALLGPMYGYSDTWQLVINTGTTIVTFLMVFLIQNTQNRDSTALHLKLDELLRATKRARNSMVDLEHCSDEELRQFQEEFKAFREKYAQHKAQESQKGKPEATSQVAASEQS